ncbi:MAG: hypothetical protein Q9217_003145 [Psora testacea]
MPSERAVTSWDDMIPLSCQKDGNLLHRPGFRAPSRTLSKPSVLGVPTAGKTARSPIEVDSGDNSSSDGSGSDTEYEASSVTTSTFSVSPGFGSSNEGKIKNVMMGAGGPVTAALNLHEHRDSHGPGDGDRVEHGVEGVLADPEMDGVEVGNGDRCYTKDDYTVEVGSDIEVGQATWDVIKITGDEQSGEARVLKVEAKA